MYYYPSSYVRQYKRSGERSMTVTGVGTVTTTPNVATVQIGIITENKELEQAQQQNAQLTTNVIESMMQLGIPQENIQTQDYTIFPKYDYTDGKQVFQGYQVTHTLLITINNLNQTGIVIDTAVKNGANRISNIQFTFDDMPSLYQEALSRSLQNALSKAQTIATTMSLNLDPTPTRIIELVNEAPVPLQTFAKSEAVSHAETPIEPGQLTITAKVNVQFYYSG
ncbi:SIMPL domain-containing protein [Pontibacillus litoralis]|uniref:DUF541 domain-containing protein n=1 Tax=Pontibacillus litoralis JSM 072002 TaxID=1385512 RepID=A0A0A5G3H9_9BACI|nr:SIMPL domain-containing protein [Pontibacillus litoralis]KGX86584.1 hypothetical protein N784_04205 [Pontibacillus litoralis JSM 072002]